MAYQLPKIELMFRSKEVLDKHYLSDPPYGGLAVVTCQPLEVDDMVDLRIWLMSEGQCEDIRGVVIWRRLQNSETIQVGVAFLVSESEKRERLLGGILPRAEMLQERREERHRLALRVVYRTPLDFVVDYTRNISMGGMFIKTHFSIPIGTMILFKLCPPGRDETIELFGRVAWQSSGEGLGIRFVDNSLEVLDRLRRLVCSMPLDRSLPLIAGPQPELVH